MKKVLAAMGCWMVLLWGLWGSAVAGDYKLPDTGQNRCYDNSTEIRCPDPGEAFHGQDAQYAGPQPAFQDNGDGTVTDLNTGLMWQQDDEHNSTLRYWTTACDYCDELTLADHSDWRIPNRHELFSIVDYGHHSVSPSIDTTYFPNCIGGLYWTGSRCELVGDFTYAWGVAFNSGQMAPIIAGGNCIVGKYKVRCVR